MNKIYFSLLIVFLLSCKEKPNSNSNNASFITIFTGGKLKIDSTLINKQDSLIKFFYKNFDNETVWHDDEKRNLIINEFNNCEIDGLNPDDYNATKLNNLSKNYDNLSEIEAVDFDLELTNYAQKYISHLSKGKLNPYELYDDWDLGKKEVDVIKILSQGLKSNNFKDAIDSCKPNHFVYKQLQDALKKLKSYPDKYIEQIDLREKFTPGVSSKYIIDMKRKLLYWGDLKGKDSALTKVYDKPTQEAIKKFQKRHGLNPDGVVGKSTIDALNYTKNQRIEQVVVNMERWKWCVKNLGNHYILVNIPDFKLTVYKDDDSTRSHKTVVGKDSRKTPILSSKISNIVLNPTWTVPPTILKEDVFPAAQRNKNAFRRKGLRILDYKGREINPYKWKIENAKRYRYVQNPSRNNSLGSMKVDFPNNYAVYLHDTNHREMFARDYRALSSGCVRVDHPLDLAQYLINDTINWSEEKIQNKTRIKPLKTTFIKMTEDVYVHQFYWTAWQENNELNFREDIYCYDSNLFSKLRY